MSDKRPVLVWVDDERVTDLSVEHLYISEDGEDFIDSEVVIVPPDDQLTRDLDAVTRYFLGRVPTEPNDAAMRLRAAFHLNEGNDNA